MNRLDDDEKLMVLGRLQIILQDMNSILTEDAETNKPFLIVEDWNEVGKIQQNLNKWWNSDAYYEWVITYYNEYGHEAFQDMRFGKGPNGEPRNVHNSKPYYEVPEGIFDLDDVIDWGFADEYTTCGNWYKSIEMTPGYHGDKPRYAIINDELLCGDCIVEHYEDDYIESVTNKTSNAINTAIISEERLKELGWKELSKTYTAGLREGSNDNPTMVYNTLKKKYDVLFTYQSDQFDTNFWAWIKKPTSTDAAQEKT